MPVPDDTSDIIRDIARRIILGAVRDLQKGRRVESVIQYLDHGLFTVHRKQAGYPIELHDTLRDAVLCSEVHRKNICEEVEVLLKQLNNSKKKSPPKRGLPRSIT